MSAVSDFFSSLKEDLLGRRCGRSWWYLASR